MKTSISYTLLAAAMACGLAQGQTTAYTTPVGYITASIAPNTAASPAGAATYISASLDQPTSFQGAAAASPSGAATVTFASGVPTGLNGAYVLEISNGAQEGWWSPVISSTATSVTVADIFPASLAANVSVSVKKFTTIKSLFGANTANLAIFDGVGQADEIQLLNTTTGVVSSIVYLPAVVSGDPTDKWLDFVLGVSADDYIVPPGVAVRVIRYGATGTSLVSSGTVKTTKTQVDVFPTENWLGNSLATGGTIGSMGFFNTMVKYDGEAANDFLNVLAPNQTTSQYIALDPTVGTGMLDFVLGTDAAAVPIPQGTGYVLLRNPAKAASILTIPAQTIGN